MFKAYKNTHFRPGQTNKLCPTGVQFPTLFDGGAGAGYKSNGGSVPAGGHGGVGFGNFDFTMVDKLKVPDVPPGEYSVSWRWSVLGLGSGLGLRLGLGLGSGLGLRLGLGSGLRLG